MSDKVVLSPSKKGPSNKCKSKNENQNIEVNNIIPKDLKKKPNSSEEIHYNNLSHLERFMHTSVRKKLS